MTFADDIRAALGGQVPPRPAPQYPVRLSFTVWVDAPAMTETQYDAATEEQILAQVGGLPGIAARIQQAAEAGTLDQLLEADGHEILLDEDPTNAAALDAWDAAYGDTHDEDGTPFDEDESADEDDDDDEDELDYDEDDDSYDDDGYDED